MSTNASLDRLKFCNFKLRTLLNITQAINDNLPTSELLKSFERLLITELNIGKVLVYRFDNSWEIILKSGIDENDYKNLNIETDILTLTEITITLSIENEKLKAFDFIIPVFHNHKALAYVLIGDFEEEQEGISPTIKHLHFIQTLTNIIFVAIENKRLVEQSMEQERMKKELEMASKMQEMLVPDANRLPKNKFVSVAPFYLPHFEVGGDYYDFDVLSDDEIFFCVADVSGKGMSAALLMSNFQANLKALFTSDILLTDLIAKLNERVIKSANGEKFITLFVAKYNTFTRELNYVNAGHVSPILYDMSKKSIEQLDKGCMGMGMIDDIPVIKVGALKIENPSKLLLFTDGLVELEIENQVSFSQTYIEQIMATNKPIHDTINDIIEKVNINKNNPSIFDDVTILGIEFF